MAAATIFSRGLPTRTQFIPRHNRQRLREEFGMELVHFRARKGYPNDVRTFARIAKVSMMTIHTLEGARRTPDHVTLCTLHKIAFNHGAEIHLDTNPMIDHEPQCGATTTLEEFWAMGIRLRFAEA
jgi:hypothetical protein